MHYVQITGDLAEKNMTRQNGADIHEGLTQKKNRRMEGECIEKSFF